MKITILVEPKPKLRPRAASSKGGRAFVYTPGATVHAENLIRDKVMECMPEPFPQGIPLYLEATFYRQRPKSMKKSVLLPVSKPDWDQYAKLLCDALEKFLYYNDAQITTAFIRKRFGSPPRIEMEIRGEIVLI